MLNVLCHSKGFRLGEKELPPPCILRLVTCSFAPVLIVIFLTNVLIVLKNIYDNDFFSVKSLRNFNLILPLPFNNSIVSFPTNLELSSTESEGSGNQNHEASPSPSHNITFTTGLITIIMNFASIILTTAIAAAFAYKQDGDDSWLILNNLVDIIFTTFVPLYWILANEELAQFSIRFIKRRL